MHQLETMFKQAESPARYAADYFSRMSEVMRALDLGQIEAACDAIEDTIERGGAIYLMANGGSSAVASHFVNDAVCGAWADGATPIRAYALADNVESVTALANDYGYDGIFINQLRMLMREGDLVIAMSVSGNSENLVRAVDWANAHGGRTMAWTGFAGGRLKQVAQISIHMPTTNDEYGPVEDMFSILEHIITTYLAMKRGRKLYK